MIRDKDEQILSEKMAQSLFVQVHNPNMSIIQENEEVNRVVLPSLSLVLTNRIIINFYQ